jgi:putative ABC transport system permease protein
MARAIYRVLLLLLPEATRARHGDEMQLVFDDNVRAARADGVAPATAAVVREVATLVRFAWRERRAQPPRPLVPAAPPPEGRPSMTAPLLQDLRYAGRLLRRSPGFTVVAVLTMALAIGANTAIFSVVNGVLLRSLPFADPDGIVVLGHRVDGRDTLDSTTPGNLQDWMRAATAFSAMAGFAATERIVTVHGNAERIRGGLSVGSLFSVLGRAAADGRTLTPADDDPAADPVVVLSARLSRRLFGDARSLGQSIAINGTPHTIVGVMPPDFAFFDYDYEYWVPARFDAAFRANRDQYFLLGVARLGPGTSLTQANAQLNTVMDAIRIEFPQFTQNAVAAVIPMKEVLLDGVETRLLVLMGAVGFVLLIACANLGNLLLARATTRRREMAVRHALGADKSRLVRQMIAENLLLAVLGGLAGLVVGAVFLRVLMSYLPDTLPRRSGISLDGAVLIFTAAVSLAAGLVFGAFPAIQVTGRRVMSSLREGTRSSPKNVAVRRGLVASQVALALILLVGAGLMLRSVSRLLDVSPGFTTEELLTFTASVPAATYRTAAERAAFFERAATALEALPGVRNVTLTTTLPVAGRGNGAWFNIIARPLPPSETPPGVPNRVVRANYFESLGIPLRRGRTFTTGDGLHGTRAVVVSESVARRFFPDGDAIGQRIYMGTSDNRVVPDSEIVGIVADVKQLGLDEERPEAVYVPHALVPVISSFTFAIRTTGDPAALAPAARDVMRRLDPGVPLIRVQTMEDIIGRTVAPARSSMVLIGLFAAVALTLALVGVFGVLSYTVSQRTAELGIRMALGASAQQVTWSVLGQGLMPVGVGVVIGVGGALLLTRFMQSLLFGITPTDPLTFAAVALLLGGSAAAAAYVPARRATRLDPVKALRNE